MLQFWILFPAHVCDVWYLAADLVGLLFAVALIIKFGKKVKGLPKWLAETLYTQPFAVLVMITFISVSFGIGVSPYWQYGANHTVGLIGMTFVGLWIFEKILTHFKSPKEWKIILTLSLICNGIFVWLILPAMQAGFADETSIFFKVFFWDNASESEIKNSLVYLNDLANHSSTSPMFFGFALQLGFIYLLLKTNLFTFFSTNKICHKPREASLTFARPKKVKSFWVYWVLYSIITFALALRVFDVYAGANRGIVVLPIVGYQMAFWMVMGLVQTWRMAGGKIWRSL